MGACKHREEDVYRGVREGILEIDDQGRIWRVAFHKGRKGGRPPLVIPCERRRAESKSGKDYLNLRATYGGQRFTAKAHRVVWFHFYGHIPEGKEINHKNGIKDQNWPGNLELVTHTENCRHAYSVLGRTNPSGEASPRAKISSLQVEEIRRRWDAGETQRAIADDLGIAYGSISPIANGIARIHG